MEKEHFTIDHYSVHSPQAILQRKQYNTKAIAVAAEPPYPDIEDIPFSDEEVV